MLLHSCCAPCSGAVLECLLANGIRPVVFFSNSNIVPEEEYRLRLSELARYCTGLGLPLVADEYDHRSWLDFVLGRCDGASEGRQAELAAAPERGERCLRCFKFRLGRAAGYAAAHGIPVLTTTLASSRWKSLEQVAEAGEWAVGAQKCAPEELRFWNQNWRRGGLQERRSRIICEQGFYNQNWCGCEFSHRNV